MDKQLIEKLNSEHFNVKDFINWNQPFPQQEFNLNLQQLKSRLEAELSEAIESHVIRKQKSLSNLQKSIQIILNTKKKTAEIFANKDQILFQQGKINTSSNQSIKSQIDANQNKQNATQNLQNLVQLINLKTKIDYCLQKLQPIVNAENTEQNQQEGAIQNQAQ